ncbi:MAG: hypothetical protein JO013_02720 [Alphaproteobacteria bacterium]|nr:hypothetical protein [Alphaproteobacteria bacterium]
MIQLFAALLAAPPPPDPALVPIIREVGKVCAAGAPIRTEADLAFALILLSPPEGGRTVGCRADRALALRAARALAEAPSGSSAAAMRFLGEASAEGRGMPRDAAASESWYLRAYALDGVTFIPAAIPQARRDAYLASDEAIAMLRDRLRRGSPAGEQLRLAAALILRHAPGDIDEAATLAGGDETIEAQRLRLQIAHKLLAGTPSPAREAAAAALLVRAPSALQFDAASRAETLSLGTKRLQAAPTPGERAAAIALLGAAAVGGQPDAVGALTAALRRENGGRDPAEVEAVPAMKVDIGPEDYPPAALRAETQGVVRLRALINPAGRVVALVPATADQPPLLVEAVRRLVARRTPAAVDLPGPRPTPWLWMKLPSVGFSIRG